MTFIVFKGRKKLGIITAKDLDEARKIGDKQYPAWTEIYITGHGPW
jgi:hypothetical protein